MREPNWHEQYQRNILMYIGNAKRDGVTAMGLENLFMCVQVPSSAPMITPMAIQRAFNKICNARSEIKEFLIEPVNQDNYEVAP